MFDRLKKSLKGIVDRISKSEIKDEDLEPLLWDLQLQLISNDVAMDVAAEISNNLKERLKGLQVTRFSDKSEPVRNALREAIESVLDTNGGWELLDKASEKKRLGEPLVVMFVGINGTGKTTTIAKITKRFQNNGYSVVLASGDTYRAGAIEQLEEHARRLGVKVIKHQYGSDAAAVSYDAVQHARAQKIDVVLIDTAGRMQTNRNLMDELLKIKRIVKPDITLLILDSLIGNDAVEQAKTFNDRVGFDAVILTKVDADSKGGSSLSVAYITGKPILYIGVGQEYSDLQKFDANWFAEKLLTDA